VDAFIVEQNIQREIHAEENSSTNLDATYFLDLSDDAIPALVTAFQNPTLTASVRDSIGASLACIRHERGLYDQEAKWQSFHFATYNADNALTSIRNNLKAYKINNTNYPAVVTTPAGEEFPCSTYYYD